MSNHEFYHLAIIILKVDQQVLSINALFHHCMTHGSIFHVGVNLITRNMLALKDQRLPKKTSIMQSKYPHHQTEGIIHSHCIAGIVDLFSHFQHEHCSLRMVLKFGWVAWPISVIIWEIFSLLQLDLLHNWPTLIAISNRVVFVAIWMGILRHKHKFRAMLIEPRAHWFVTTIDPGWDVVLLVVLVKCTKYLLDIVELVLKFRQWCIGVGNCNHNLKKPGFAHVISKSEGTTLLIGDSLVWLPILSMGILSMQHMKNLQFASKPP